MNFPSIAAVPPALRKLRFIDDDGRATNVQLTLEQINQICSDSAARRDDESMEFSKALYQIRQEFAESHQSKNGFWVPNGGEE